MKSYAIGADIGGSHISCALINMEEKKLLRQSLKTRQVNNKATAAEILDNWSVALRHTMEKISNNELVGVGFAMPGPFDYQKGIALFTSDVAKYEKLYHIDVAGELSGRLGLSTGQFRFMNDATAFAVGEAWTGKASKAVRSLSITLGTGFGSAFVDQGIPVVERNDVPKSGCVWHLPYKDSIADEYFSTRWFVKRYYDVSHIRIHGVKDIAEKAETDKAAKDIFIEFGANLGEFLGSWLKKFRTEVLVIGGNVSGAYPLFQAAFNASLKAGGVNIEIEISDLMEESAIAGSAHMFDENFWLQVQPLLSKM